MRPAQSYRGWSIEPEFVGWFGLPDGWEPGAQYATGDTLADVRDEIDVLIDEDGLPGEPKPQVLS